MTPVRLEPAALRSRVKHSTTEPLRSLEWSYGILIYSVALPDDLFNRLVCKQTNREAEHFVIFVTHTLIF